MKVEGGWTGVAANEIPTLSATVTAVMIVPPAGTLEIGMEFASLDILHLVDVCARRLEQSLKIK